MKPRVAPPVDVEVLREWVTTKWAKGTPLSLADWEHVFRAGLYEWAAELQLASVPASEIPSAEVLQSRLAPALLIAPVESRPLLKLEAQQTPLAPPLKPLSTRRLRKNRDAVAAVQARQERHQAIAYSPRDLVMFALPHKATGLPVYERTNGSMRFLLSARDGHQIPFGQDRLLPLWLATAFQAAGQPQDNRIRFRSGGDILAAFRQTNEGGALKTLSERILRWYNTTIDVIDERPGAHRRAKYDLIKAISLWWQTEKSTNQNTLWQNVIELDAYFANDIRKGGAIPVDFETIVALKDSPGALDLYVWQAHRSWELAQQNADRPTVIPLPLLAAQMGSRSPPRRQRQLFSQWQRIVKEVWRECPNYYDARQDLFFVHPSRAVFDRTTVSLPGVVPNPPVPEHPRPAGSIPGLIDLRRK